MKLFTRFILESEGGNGGSNGGGSPTLLGGGSQQPSQQQASNPNAGDSGNEGSSAFDFRSLLDDKGGFRQGWDSSLPDDLKPSAGAFTKYPNPLELLRGHANAAKLIGQKTTLKPPAPDAKPEELDRYNAAIRDALAIPAKVEDYKIAMPENLPDGMKMDDAQVKEFTALAHSLNIPASAAQKLVEFDMKRMSALQQTGQAKLAEFVKAQGAELQKEWGDKTAENISRAKRAAELLGLDVHDPELGNNAKFIRAMHTAAGLMKDDKLIGVDAASVTNGGVAQAEDIRRNPNNPWHKALHGKEGPERQREAFTIIKRLQGVKD